MTLMNKEKIHNSFAVSGEAQKPARGEGLGCDRACKNGGGL